MTKEVFGNPEEVMKRPTGAISFRKTVNKDQLFCKNTPKVYLYHLIAGEQAIWLERDQDYKFCFYHSSPGTGTRVAKIDADEIEISDKLHYILEWSPEEVRLNVGAVGIEGAKLHFAIGIKSKMAMRIIGDEIIWAGDGGDNITGVRLISNGKVLLEPTAIELWKETVMAIKILRDGFNNKDYLHEIIKNNSAIRMIVTGFEVYCKKRIVELQKEGIEPDMDSLINKIFSKYEREQNNPENMKENAKKKVLLSLRI